MEIDHKLFPNGYQNLRLMVEGKDKPIMTIAIILPGVYDFGVVERNELITVTHGSLKINGVILHHQGNTYVVEPGDNVVMEAEEVSVIKCTFPETN